MSSSPQFDLVIIGGGIAGLSTAWHSIQNGLKVLVLEASTCGNGATNKAAGMISPTSEALFGEEKNIPLYLESFALYPQFISTLEKATSMGEAEIDFSKKGSYLVAIDDDDRAELERLQKFYQSLNLNVKECSPDEAITAEPLLSPQIRFALRSQNEYFLDPNSLVLALKTAIEKSGSIIAQNTEVTAIEVRGHNDFHVWINHIEKIECKKLLLAYGLNQSFASGLPSSLQVPLRPVKGQVMEVKQARGFQKLTHCIRTNHRYPVYLVPRLDGRIVIGATMEEKGYDTTVTAGATIDLLYGAWRAIPSLDEMEVIGHWAGHRPATPDHAPVIGPTEFEGLSVCLGLYRHGILLAPVAGKILAEHFAKGTHSDYFNQFGMGRFKK